MRRIPVAMLAVFAGALLLTADARQASAQAPSGGGQGTQATSPQPRRLVAPVRGPAELGYLRPVTKVVGDTVVTVIKVKNLAGAPIAGLRIDEFWYDKNDTPLPSDSQRLKQPLGAGEVATIELRTPKSPGMARNNYKFSHANGEIKAKLLDKIE